MYLFTEEELRSYHFELQLLTPLPEKKTSLLNTLLGRACSVHTQEGQYLTYIQPVLTACCCTSGTVDSAANANSLCKLPVA